MKKMLLMVATLLFGASTAALAQEDRTGSITGAVYQAVGADTLHLAEEPIPGATIRALETPYSAQSDDRGQFTLSPLPPGPYALEIRRIGYRPVHQSVRVVAGQNIEIKVHLTTVPITVDAVVVEALQDQSHRTYDLSELQKVALVGTANVTAVTLRQIKEVHARDPFDLVREATGLEVHEQGQGPGFASDAVIRGFTSDHSADVALVVDGVPINEPINGHGEGYADWNLIFPLALADVQVVKGPISPLFGNFATGGAVNVTTQAATQQTSIQAEGGSHMFGAGTLTTGLERGPWGAFLGVNGIHNDGWRDNSKYDVGQFIARGNRRVGSELLLDAGMQVYSTKWKSPGYLSLAQFNAGDLTPATDVTDGGLKRRYQGRLSAVLNKETFQWQNAAWGYSSYWHLYLTLPELGFEGEGIGSQSEELDRRYGFGGRSIAKWTLGTVELTVGADAQRQHSNFGLWGTVARNRDITLKRFDATFTSLAGFAGLAKTFGRRLRLEGAMRADQLRPKTFDETALVDLPAESHLVLQPKAGAVFYASGDLQFYASAARGFRNAPGTLGEPSKTPVSIWAGETGMRFLKKTFEGSLAFFRLSTRNETVYNPITLENEDSGHSLREGVEAELKVRPVPQFEFETHVTFNTKGIFFLADTAGLTPAARLGPLLNVVQSNATAAPTRLMHDEGASGPVPGVADYAGRVGFTVRPTPALWMSTWATVMGPYVPLGEPDARTTAYAIGNVQAGVHFNDHIELTVGLDNALNQRAPELRASGAVNPVAPRILHLNVNTRW